MRANGLYPNWGLGKTEHLPKGFRDLEKDKAVLVGLHKKVHLYRNESPK